MSHALDPVELTQRLIRCPSVTPQDAGALDVVEAELAAMGFTCHRLRFEEPGTEPVENLYARKGESGRNLCFAGHTDVVPAGDAAHWSVPPFAARIRDGVLTGRGAADMKGAIAAMIVAIQRFLADRGDDVYGSISLLITGDEEGPAVNGTKKVLDWLAARGETLDACVVGEPTNPDAMGDMIKVGRRGSLNAWLTVHGTQGHVAYPHLADNPVHTLTRVMTALTETPLDAGNDFFQPSSLQMTDVAVGNPAHNVIPANATARLNIRFNDLHTGATLTDWLHRTIGGVTTAYDLDVKISGESFLTPPGPLVEIVASAVQEVTGRAPDRSTTGGTSDARFIKSACPVVECGLINKTIHKVDECAAVADIAALTDIYRVLLDGYFPAG